MQAEFSQLIKEENFINTGLVCRFNGREAGLIRRSAGDKQQKWRAWSVSTSIANSEHRTLTPDCWHLCASTGNSSWLANPEPCAPSAASEDLSILGACQWKIETLFLSKVHTFLLSPNETSFNTPSHQKQNKKLLANIQVFNNAIKMLRMPTAFVCALAIHRVKHWSPVRHRAQDPHSAGLHYWTGRAADSFNWFSLVTSIPLRSATEFPWCWHLIWLWCNLL